VAVLGVGLVVRVLVMVAYPPALFFGDSWGYLVSAFGGHPVALSNIHPDGYPLLLRLLTLPDRDMAQITAVQHLVGLAVGTIVYVVLVRVRIPRTAAAAAAALVLLDGYAIALEQYVMSDTFFTLAVLLAVLLVARPALLGADGRAGWRAAAGAGLLVAASVLLRSAGLFVAPLILVYLLWTRAGWRPLAAFVVALAVPLLAYCAAEDARFHTFGFSQTSGWLSYGRVAGFADCSGVHVAPGSRPLCETAAQRHAHPDAPDWYIFSPASPAVKLFGGYAGTVAAQRRSNAALGTFARRIVEHQPLDYLDAVARDVLRYFTPGATPYDDAVSATALPKAASAEEVVAVVHERYLPHAHLRVQSPASVVRAYRRVIHVPRPVLALLVLASLAALALRVPARREVLLLSGTGVALILGTALSAGFGVRYLMPAVPLVAIGGTLAARDLWAREQARRRRPATAQ
jgi:branched-subunit amino acid transport protein AzlD